MKIAHISDIHLSKNGKIIWNTDTLYNFNRLLAKLNDITDLDAIVITGDLSDDGSKWAYKYIDNAFMKIGIPTYCVPGNHDSLPIFNDEYTPVFYSTSKTALINNWKFLFLNSVIPDDIDPTTNKSKGYISLEDLGFIEKELNEGLQTCICLHHPPLEPGGWLNRKLLDNRDELNSILLKFSNLKCVLYGHIHYHTQVKVSHILYSSAPSIGFAFDRDLPKFQIAKGNEGFSIIQLDDDVLVKRLFI